MYESEVTMVESGPEGYGSYGFEVRSERGEGTSGARKDRRWSVISGWDLNGTTFGVELPDTYTLREAAVVEFTRTHPTGQGGNIKYALVSIKANQAFTFGRPGSRELLNFQPLTDERTHWEIGEDAGPRTVTITTAERA